jgi:uncharacterized protein
VITGDFAIGNGWNESVQTSLGEMAEELSALAEKYPTLAVLGNHDYWTNEGAVRAALADSGIENISNDVYTLSKGGELFHIAGVDDIWEGHDRLDIVLAKLPKDGAAVLLAHEPDFADRARKPDALTCSFRGIRMAGRWCFPCWGRRSCHTWAGNTRPGCTGWGRCGSIPIAAWGWRV